MKQQIDPSVAVELAGHHPYIIFTLFVIGYLLHAWMQVDSVVRSKNNPTTSRWMVIEQNGSRLVGRFFISLMAFLYIWGSPSTVPTILGYIGLTLSPTTVALMTLPMSPPVAGSLGFFFDSLLTFIPMLKNALPPIEFTQRETSVKETTIKETRTIETPPAPEAVPPKAGD